MVQYCLHVVTYHDSLALSHWVADSMDSHSMQHKLLSNHYHIRNVAWTLNSEHTNAHKIFGHRWHFGTKPHTTNWSMRKFEMTIVSHDFNVMASRTWCYQKAHFSIMSQNLNFFFLLPKQAFLVSFIHEQINIIMHNVFGSK